MLTANITVYKSPIIKLNNNTLGQKAASGIFIAETFPEVLYFQGKLLKSLLISVVLREMTTLSQLL